MRKMLMVTMFFLSCGEYALPEPRRSFGIDSGVADGGSAATRDLCMLTREGEDAKLLPGIVIIAETADDVCVAKGDAMDIVIERELPQDVDLYGEPGAHYCIGVRRLGGYITISHERGDVDRTDDEFRWCIIQESKHPEYMTIRSLTREARVRLLLPQGL